MDNAIGLHIAGISTTLKTAQQQNPSSAILRNDALMPSRMYQNHAGSISIHASVNVFNLNDNIPFFNETTLNNNIILTKLFNQQVDNNVKKYAHKIILKWSPGVP